MSPAPAKTSYQQIVATARQLIEEQGLDSLSMQTVAEGVGIRAPSLYKHVHNRAQLIRSVVEYTQAELGETLALAAQMNDPTADLRAMVYAYRAFAHQYPTVYKLLYSSLSPEMEPSAEVSAAAVTTLLGTVTKLVGQERSLEAARMLVAFTHGFVNIELAGAFRLGGSVESAFDFGVETLISALQVMELIGSGLQI